MLFMLLWREMSDVSALAISLMCAWHV